MKPHPLLATIPDELLRRAPGGADAVRALRLLTWAERVGYRPTLADLEDERERRGMTPPRPTRANREEESTR